jgi:2-dehydro-3-deoxygluconokinase
MNERFAQSKYVQMSFTGAEANVCCALGIWGEKTEFVTKLPDNILAQSGVAFLRGTSVDTSHIVYGEGRMGTYYLEHGHGIRSSVVVYDRAHSVFCESRFDDYQWNEILEGAYCLYVSGITPALSDGLFDCVLNAMKAARSKGISVYFDVNYRAKLLSVEKAAFIFNALSPYITHLIGNEEHLKSILNINSDHGEDQIRDRLTDITTKVSGKTGIPNIAVTVRRTISADHTVFYASYYDGRELALSPKYDLYPLDRVGSGDAFSAGLIYSVKKGSNAADSVRFAAASCAMKHEISNDINFSSVEEINSLMANRSLDVKR